MRSQIFTLSNSNVKKKDLIDQGTDYLNELSEEVSQKRIKSDKIFFQCSKYFPKYYELKKEIDDHEKKGKELYKEWEKITDNYDLLVLYYMYLVKEEINKTPNKNQILRQEIEKYLENFKSNPDFKQLGIVGATIYISGENDKFFTEKNFLKETILKLGSLNPHHSSLSEKFKSINNKITRELPDYAKPDREHEENFKNKIKAKKEELETFKLELNQKDPEILKNLYELYSSSNTKNNQKINQDNEQKLNISRVYYDNEVKKNNLALLTSVLTFGTLPLITSVVGFSAYALQRLANAPLVNYPLFFVSPLLSPISEASFSYLERLSKARQEQSDSNSVLQFFNIYNLSSLFLLFEKENKALEQNFSFFKTRSKIEGSRFHSYEVSSNDFFGLITETVKFPVALASKAISAPIDTLASILKTPEQFFVRLNPSNKILKFSNNAAKVIFKPLTYTATLLSGASNLLKQYQTQSFLYNKLPSFPSFFGKKTSAQTTQQQKEAINQEASINDISTQLNYSPTLPDSFVGLTKRDGTNHYKNRLLDSLKKAGSLFFKKAPAVAPPSSSAPAAESTEPASLTISDISSPTLQETQTTTISQEQNFAFQQHQQSYQNFQLAINQQLSSSSDIIIDPKFTLSKNDLAEIRFIRQNPQLNQYYQMMQKCFNEAFLFANIVSHGGTTTEETSNFAKYLEKSQEILGDIPFASLIISQVKSVVSEISKAKTKGQQINFSDMVLNASIIDNNLLTEKIARRFTITRELNDYQHQIIANKDIISQTNLTRITAIKEYLKNKVGEFFKQFDQNIAKGFLGKEINFSQQLAILDFEKASEIIFNQGISEEIIELANEDQRSVKISEEIVEKSLELPLKYYQDQAENLSKVAIQAQTQKLTTDPITHQSSLHEIQLIEQPPAQQTRSLPDNTDIIQRLEELEQKSLENKKEIQLLQQENKKLKVIKEFAEQFPDFELDISYGDQVKKIRLKDLFGEEERKTDTLERNFKEVYAQVSHQLEEHKARIDNIEDSKSPSGVTMVRRGSNSNIFSSLFR